MVGVRYSPVFLNHLFLSMDLIYSHFTREETLKTIRYFKEIFDIDRSRPTAAIRDTTLQVCDARTPHGYFVKRFRLSAQIELSCSTTLSCLDNLSFLSSFFKPVPSFPGLIVSRPWPERTSNRSNQFIYVSSQNITRKTSSLSPTISFPRLVEMQLRPNCPVRQLEEGSERMMFFSPNIGTILEETANRLHQGLKAKSASPEFELRT